jgi:competence ComEA-like helix-hairpin-helix protein
VAGLPPSRRRLLLWLWAACTGLLLIRLFAAGLHADTIGDTPLTVPVRIDLNRAPVPELMALPGIGRQRARAIVLHRVRHGPFARLPDLLQIDGIGPQTLAALRPQVLPLPGDTGSRGADSPGDRLP